jgi:hypothetical protein
MVLLAAPWLANGHPFLPLDCLFREPHVPDIVADGRNAASSKEQGVSDLSNYWL